MRRADGCRRRSRQSQPASVAPSSRARVDDGASAVESSGVDGRASAPPSRKYMYMCCDRACVGPCRRRRVRDGARVGAYFSMHFVIDDRTSVRQSYTTKSMAVHTILKTVIDYTVDDCLTPGTPALSTVIDRFCASMMVRRELGHQRKRG